MNTELYIQIETAVRNLQQEVSVNAHVTPEDIRHVVRWVMRDNPDIFWFAHQYHYDEVQSSIHFQYTFSKERVNTIQQSITDVIENDFCIEYVKTLTPQKQITYVYKWLVSYCNYNVNSAYNQTIYSVFVRRNSVCTGYAKAAQYLFKLLDIDSRLVFGRLHNDKEDGRHCWNLVKYGDQYYHFDACFGDRILDGVALHSGVEELFTIDGVNYNFLCVSTHEMLKTRIIEDVVTLPSCLTSWSKDVVRSLAGIEIKQREDIKGCLLSHIGSSADIYLCSKDKNTVLKVFRSNSKTACTNEYSYMRRLEGCSHVLQPVEQYTDLSNHTIAIEQSIPLVDLLCSHYYELTLKGLIKIIIDIAKAWKECKDKGVLYRDIHICNIYRSNDGTFKVGDFGSCTDNFKAKEIVGNQWFMAPETFVHGIFTESSAIYSISMVMYFILNNMRPAFWALGSEDEALQKRMHGDSLPIPVGCAHLPHNIQTKITDFFNNVVSVYRERRISHIDEFLYSVIEIFDNFGYNDYTILPEGISLDFDIEAGNRHRLANSWGYINRAEYHKYAMGDEVERMCTTAYHPSYTPSKTNLFADEVENFARTMAAVPTNNILRRFRSRVRGNRTVNKKHRTDVTFQPRINKIGNNEKSFLRKLLDWQYNNVFSSIFSPAEVKRKSHLQVQVYLHLYEETEIVKSLAKEADKNAERRDYIPLSLKLKKGDRVDVEFNVYGETKLMSERKSLIWQGSFTKCSFDYFVPENINVDELSCQANLFVNGALIGEMRFLTQIVDASRNINPEIFSHCYKKIFISYAHKDFSKVKFMAQAYKAQGVDYFLDRDYLKAGDIYPKKIQDYINSADLFVLCWSKNAAESDYVAKEKAQALSIAKNTNHQDGTLTIHPISIVPRAELPDDMKNNYNFDTI